MKISLFSHTRDNQPRIVDLSWDELVKAFATPRRTLCTVENCARKGGHGVDGCAYKDGPAWSPLNYVEGTTRKADNVIDVHALALDVDHTTDAELGGIFSRIEQRGLRAIVHPSHSDRPDDRCVRIVIELEHPIPGPDWKAFRAAAIADLGIPADKSTKDSSRLFFFPSRPSDADYRFGTSSGLRPYNVAYKASSEPVAHVSTSAEGPTLPSLEARAVAASDLSKYWPKSGRHDFSRRLSGGLASDKWPLEAIAGFVAMVARLAGDGDGNPEKRRIQAKDSIAAVTRGSGVDGWFSLIRDGAVPESVVCEVRERLGIVSDFVIDETTQGARDALMVSALSSLLPGLPVPKSRAIGDLALIETPPVISYPTGIDELDRLLGGGLSTQQMIAILGKPGAGKSALVISIAIRLQVVVPVLYCTTELGTNEIVARIAAPILRVPWRDIVRHKAIKPDGTKVTQADVHAALQTMRIWVIGQDEIYKAGENCINLIERVAVQMKTEFGASPVVFVDYMQELARGGDKQELRNKTTMVAVRFRQMSQAIDCACGLVSSVNRKGYGIEAEQVRQGDDATLYMSLAKESGDIDYAAATIIFVDVADGKDRDMDGWRPGRIAVAKSRHGETGFAGVRFHGATGRWEEYREGVQALSAEARLEKRQRESMNLMEERILQQVTATPKISRTGLANLVKGNNNARVLAINTLIEQGKLIEIDDDTFNPITKRRNQGKVFILGSALGAVMSTSSRPPEDPVSFKETLAIVAGTKT